MARSTRTNDVHPITTRALEVLRVEDVTPGMRRVTLGGEQLRAFRSDSGYPVAEFRSSGFDDNLKIVFCHPDLDEPLVPTQGDGALAWPRDPRSITRTYTIRRWDPVAGEADIDFVRHGSGPATSWAYRATPGERVHVAGPKMSRSYPEGVDWALIAGDETALPAIGRWIEESPDGLRAQVFVEVAEPAHRQDLPVRDGITVTWLSRDGAPAGSTPLLFDAIRAAQWWDGSVFVWVAGEATSLTPIRRWLREDKNVPKDHLDVVGYWRRSADEPDVADSEPSEHDDLHDRLDLLPPFAVRVGVTVGLFDALERGPLTIPAMSAATQTHEQGLGKLVRYLAAAGALEPGRGDTYRLTAAGLELTDEWHMTEFDLGGIPARRELGVLALLAAVRTGTGDYESWFGTSFRELLRSEPAALEADEDEADVIADTLAKSELFSDVRTLVIAGRGAGRFAGAFVDARADVTVTVVGHPSELAGIRRLQGDRARVVLEPSSMLETRSDSPDGVLLANLLDLMPDEDAVHVLDRAGRSVGAGGSVFVFAAPLEHATAEDYEYEDDLLHFALTGGGSRTNAEYDDLFGRAGLRVLERVTIGWGEVVFRLAPNY